MDNLDTYPFTPGILIRPFCPLSTASDQITPTHGADYVKRRVNVRIPLSVSEHEWEGYSYCVLISRLLKLTAVVSISCYQKIILLIRPEF